ncbi:response regulator [Pseudoroseicyclus aestuarii]|uniref:Response regulator receiver domain-containing protein n=1 Tax=Pseudoroseicyclus aestuarii TaxID=1795041 RepID=A0A318SW76_9RHOB|nr:response regulator [Pseudoroseicyclus aestuarii]PYE84616.1 response regulator receiver domain-containing protein [Pseudoroseicyclus aestuarii]
MANGTGSPLRDPGDRSVVIVEDDVLIAEDLAWMCRDFDLSVLETFYVGEGTAERILELAPRYVLMDVRLGGAIDGVEVARLVHDEAPSIRVVFVTGSNEPPTIQRINEDHPHRILIKPIAPQDLREAVEG